MAGFLIIVGYEIGKNIDSELSMSALGNAIALRGRHKDLIFHSDRGSQYSSKKYKAYRNGNTRKGYWAVAKSGILTQTITDKRLAQAGYFDILDKYESLHC